MKLRRANSKDMRNLFAWRNDEDTRNNSRNSSPITWEEHSDWFERAVVPGNPDNFVAMAEDARGAIGMIRFLSRDSADNYEVSINIAPERRGEGSGARFLAEACSRMKGLLVAEIKNTNMPSRKIFEKCGFEWISEHNGYILYRRPAREEV